MEAKFGWITIELNQVAEIIMGQSPPSSTYNENDIGLPFFQGKAEFTELYPIVSKWCSEPNKIAESNDILISVRAPVGATNIANQKCCIGRGLAAIRYHDCNKYVFYFLRLIEKELDKKGTGTTFKAISGSVLKSEKIPLAPLPEQRAIVTKIELLFSKLDNGISNLKLTQEQLKVYRQAVLKKAFEGELTKKWREQQKDLPDAKDLLEQIRKEREETSKVSGKKTRSVKPFTEVELRVLPEMPKGWIWVRLDAIGELFCGQSPSIAEVNKERRGVPYVTGPEQWDGSKIIETKWTEFPKRLVPEGCIFITVKGAGVGKTFPGISCAIGRDIYAFLPSSKVDFKYTIHALIHQIDVVIMKAQGDIPGLSKDHILDHCIGLCSIKEQQAIVQEIETRLSVCDKIEQDIQTNLEKAEALRQSILKKAFEGKLLNEKELAEVRGAEDWEPAEVLLERIKAEKTGNSNKEKQPTEKMKSIIQDDKGLIQQATLQAFEQIDK